MRVLRYAAAIVGIGALTLVSTTAASAAGGQTVFVNESFTGASVTGYIKPAAPTPRTNVACLTASSDTTATPVPGCSSTAIDAAGSGALRLTSAGNTLEGGIGATESVPISKGLDATFDSYQYGGTGADGIVFYLAVTDPYNPQVPTAIGQAGGSLGYSPTGASAGLAHGYLGLGLDVYGNYLNSSFDGSGCSTAPGSTTQPPNVTVRGPGNGSVGYCVLPGYNKSLGGSSQTPNDALHGTTRANSDVPVEVIINPSTSAVTSAGMTSGSVTKLTSVSVAASSYAIVFKTIGPAPAQQVVTGLLPDLRTDGTMVDSSWFDPATGLPYKLTYGWVASTGGSTDVHEVNNLTAQTVNGAVPGLAATSSVSTATPQQGSSATYMVSPSVSSSGGSESAPVQVTTTFPSGLTPGAYAGSGTGYTCTDSGQIETCTYSGTTAAGAALPALNLPFTATGNPGPTASAVTSVVASVDATAVSTSSPSVTIAKIPTTTPLTVAPTAPTYGSSETFTATVSPSAATGTVMFYDSTTQAILCAAATVTNGIATCTTTAAGPAGSHTITATYSGDANYASSIATLIATTQQSTSTITTSDSPAEIQYGTSSTLSVSGIPSGATGSVTFTDAASNALCTTTLPATTCATSTGLASGSYAVTAMYGGDANHAAATSTNAAILVVDKASATLTDTVNGKSSDSAVFGTSATLDTQGFASGSTGTITYRAADGTVLCTATLPDPSCVTSTSLNGGTYTVTAYYSGDADRQATTAPPVTLTVTPQALILSTTGTATAQTSAAGTTLTFTGLPKGATGRLTFTLKGKVLCTATLPQTSCTTNGLGAGQQTIAVSYSGDASYGSTSADVAVTVQGSDPSTLAHTGSTFAISLTIELAAALVAVGLVLMVVVRRRGRRDDATD